MKKLALIIGIFVLAIVNLSAQLITIVTPNNSFRDTTLDVTIVGQFTNFGQGTSVLNSSVWFSQATNTIGDIILPNFVTASTLTMMIANFTIPASANVGYYDVFHVNSIDGQLSLVNGYKLEYNIIGSVSEFDDKYLLKLYPNPSSDFLTIELEISEKAEVLIQLFDSQGKEIYRKNYLEENVGLIKYDLVLSSLPISTGSHIVRIQVGEDYTAKTLIIK